MTTYKGIRGVTIPTVAGDFSNIAVGDIWYNSVAKAIKVGQTTAAAWASGGALGTGRYVLAGAGTQTAGLAFGGYNGSTLNATEEYGGASWTAGGNLTTARHSGGGLGTQTAGLAFGGSPALNISEEYDGSSWAEGDNLNTARHYLAGCGLQTAGLAMGGYTGTAYTGATETYDGTSWTTASGSFNTARSYGAGCGIQTAAEFFAGNVPGTSY